MYTLLREEVANLSHHRDPVSALQRQDSRACWESSVLCSARHLVQPHWEGEEPEAELAYLSLHPHRRARQIRRIRRLVVANFLRYRAMQVRGYDVKMQWWEAGSTSAPTKLCFQSPFWQENINGQSPMLAGPTYNKQMHGGARVCSMGWTVHLIGTHVS